jgi:hypothetical protein
MEKTRGDRGGCDGLRVQSEGQAADQDRCGQQPDAPLAKPVDDPHARGEEPLQGSDERPVDRVGDGADRRQDVAVEGACDAQQDGQDFGAEEVDEALLEGAEEDLEFVGGARVEGLSEFAGGAGDHPEAVDRRVRVQCKQGVAQVLGLRAEEADGRGIPLDGVLHRAQLVEDQLQSLACDVPALGDLQRHLLGVQAERLVRILGGLRHVDRTDAEFFECVGDYVCVPGASCDALLKEAECFLAVNAQLFELDRVLLERLQEVLGIRAQLLEPNCDQVQGLVRRLRHAVLEHRRDGLRLQGHVEAEGGGDVAHLGADGFQLRVRRIRGDEARVDHRTDGVRALLEGLGDALAVQLPRDLAVLGGVLAGRAELGLQRRGDVRLLDRLRDPRNEDRAGGHTGRGHANEELLLEAAARGFSSIPARVFRRADELATQLVGYAAHRGNHLDCGIADIWHPATPLSDQAMRPAAMACARSRLRARPASRRATLSAPAFSEAAACSHQRGYGLGVFGMSLFLPTLLATMCQSTFWSMSKTSARRTASGVGSGRPALRAVRTREPGGSPLT